MTRIVIVGLVVLGLSVSGQAQTATSSSAFAITQTAPDLATANTYAYRVYETGGVATGIPLVMTCTGTASPYDCLAPIGSWTPGPHTVTFTAISCAQPACESKPSVPLTFQMQAPAPATPGAPRIVALEKPLPPVQPPSAGTLFRMDCGVNGTAYPLCGFDSILQSSFVTYSQAVNACPDGTSAVRMTQVGSATHAQYSFGYSKSLTSIDTPTQTMVRYARYRIRYAGPTNFLGNSGPWYTKFHIDGNDPQAGEFVASRVIFQTGVGSVNDTTPTVWYSKNIDQAPKINLSDNVWANIQIRKTSSSTPTSGNGRLDIWVGAANGSEATPSGSVTGLNFQPVQGGWSSAIGFGGYAQTTIRPTSRVVMDVCNVEYGTAFKTNW